MREHAKKTQTMIYEDQNKALLTVGNSAMKNADWTYYANYCFDREKGLRKEAFRHLDKFLKSTENWTTEKKIAFVKFLFPFFETVSHADYGPFPQPLSEKLVKPTLIKWCANEMHDGSPFRWYGKYYRSEVHLFKALEINPLDDLARQTILTWWTDRIYFSVHHLPDFFIGDPFEYLKLGEKIKAQIRQLTNPELSNYWTKALEAYLELVENYIEWKSSGHSNFEMWGQENNKQTGYGQARSYYFEQ